MTKIGSRETIDQIVDEARSYFDAKNKAREQALAGARGVIRASANAIRAIHRHEFPRAAQLLAEARQALQDAITAVSQYGDVRYAGFIHDAEKEYAEATTVLALLDGQPLPGPTEVGVEWPAYLNGLGEAIGELRRFLLDGLRRGEPIESEALLDAMDSIYDVLVTIDYPDSITGGLRRTTDVARGILEKTRGDLTAAALQDQLSREMATVEARIANVSSRLDLAPGTC
ncbi:MAG TPA: haloacid dehalogenase [Chloroflexota bacterium]|nr:haloacid dehalogenase [Chloroflexota bacterium]